ncbi:MAG: branched-chain amino acid ABC transporter substrate-binding protein [Rubrivivax sp.]|jgi:branched-chain amino acid transport system substrate-binding protein|nr:branched-chain amino acid ABC transporter substrate-binding protein [Betaproteobacteria bacterium]MBP6319558.1 branched-chain amino acid ABC transporter substrate-binding protein [Rubrivivax sp.]MBK7277926.1 branched-chain amino acid ABC transporter substrate-binding protein [Betaproteobacteria bacterium]MBK7457142.1 branched-chain amino acid ABC transporter substrate-binding protein [Betaproteobacteria bacterium]MBK7518141.1 branched-chain amino acid ABC transporter substrate-binding protei
MAFRRTVLSMALGAGLALGSSMALAQKGETVKIAWIDALTGLTAATGQNQLKGFQFLAEQFSKSNPAGVKFEITSFDNKLSPQETVNALQAAIDQGVRYVAQGTGTGPATAIIDFLNKYNERNPGKEVLFLNYAAVDPSLTNEKCSFWHFRLDADTSMKMEALTTFMKDQPDVKKVYLINQNYAHGHQVAKYAKENLARKRPDVQIVGEDLTPLAQTRDFAPYIAKIKASGADTIITGNWSSDLTLLVKAANDGGLNAKFYTYYAPVSGTPTAMGANAAGRVYAVGVMPYEAPAARKLMDEYKAKFNDDFYTAQIYNAYALLTAAMAKAKSTDPVKVAATLGGLEVKSLGGDVQMRKTDHQLQQAVFISRWEKAGPKPYDYSVENTGFNFRTVKTFEPYVASTPTSCQMKRPAGL